MFRKLDLWEINSDLTKRHAGLGSVTLMVGLHDTKGPFQPKWVYDSMNSLT